MCGIVGMAGDIKTAHRDAFDDMVRVCQLRGRDSTGVFKVGQNNSVAWAKRVGSPDHLLDTRAYERAIHLGHSAKALVGHCRAKTYGATSEENAHPFVFNGITGVHNGTLRSPHLLSNYAKHDVDSQMLYELISEDGIEETVKALDPDGAWALVYWNREDETLNFLRNNKRPLFFTHTKDRRVMAWASEIWMFAALYRQMELWDGGDSGHIYYPLPDDTLYSLKIDATAKEFKDIFSVNTTPVKAEVRGYSGNYPDRRGTVGFSGGQVARPFAPDEVLEIYLDDDLPVMGNVLRLPSPNHTPTASESGTSSSTGSSTPNDSSIVPFPKTTLSLPSKTSKNSLLTSSAAHSGSSGRSLFKLKKVQFRKVVGMEYVTDNKTGREFQDKDFDKLTGGVCCYCTQPIGDLTEIHEIYITTRGKEEFIRFLCSSCIVAAVA